MTEKYAEQLKQDGVSQEHVDTYVKQAEKNATSKEATDAHTASVVEEMNQEAHSIVEENVQTNIQTPADISRLDIQDIVSLNNAQIKGMSIPQLKTLITNVAELNAQTMGFAQDKILQYIDESTKSNDKLTLIRNFEGIQGDLSVDIEYMGGRNKRIAKRENGPKIGVQITVETHDAFQNKMNQFDTKTIGFEKYCGEQEVLAGIQTAVDSLFKDFTFLFEQKPIAIRYIDLQTTNDFAMIRKKDPYMVLLNKRIFDDTTYLKREYDKHQERGYFVKGTDYRAIVYHEFGHVLNKADKGLYKALNEVIGARANDANIDAITYMETYISQYAARFNKVDGNYHDALPEILAGAYSGNDFLKELLHDILKEAKYEIR